MQKALTVWEKDSRIVLGIDIGATQSAVAFSYLYKDGAATVQHVTEWPGQKAQMADAKIPTQIYYNNKGEAMKIGADTLTDEAKIEAEDEGWHLVKHFKLHLHPDTMKRQHNLTVEDLPRGITLMMTYVDFMRYLIKHTKQFFETHVLQGEEEWRRHSPSMDVVIAHPNGWGINEQNFLRGAAITAGYATLRNALSQIKFVSEAEASVHFSIFQLKLDSVMTSVDEFVVCDAGGSTVDTTAYQVKSTIPALELEEKKASDCIQAGGIFVDREAELYLRRSLTAAHMDKNDIDFHVARGVHEFETGLKRNFSGNRAKIYHLIIADRYNNPSIGVKSGRMSVAGNIIESFFKARVDEIIRSLELQMSGMDVKHILIVGGFGGSAYLRAAVKRRFEPSGCKITVVNDGPSKAVADGAVIWRIKNNVTSRAPRFSFGTVMIQPYDPSNKDHAGRTIRSHYDGLDYVSGIWSMIVQRGVVIHAGTAMRRSYVRKYDTPIPNLSAQQEKIYAFDAWHGAVPYWVMDPNDGINIGFKEICTVQADLGRLQGLLTKKLGLNGYYWILEYDIGIQFGGTELEAFIEWKEEGRTCTGNAAVIPMGLE